MERTIKLPVNIVLLLYKLIHILLKYIAAHAHRAKTSPLTLSSEAIKNDHSVVAVVQLVERQIVILVVVGSSPIGHPIFTLMSFGILNRESLDLTRLGFFVLGLHANSFKIIDN